MSNEETKQLPLRSSTIDVTTRDGVADCYLTQAASDARRRPVLLISDILGLRPLIKEMADRIARAGYVVLAPNLFYRSGRVPLWEVPDLADQHDHAAFVESVRPLIASLNLDGVRSDGSAYLERLARECEGPVGIVGYCLGGRLGWTLAATHPDRVAVLAGFHTGRMVTDKPDSPHLMAGQVKAEVYWGHADQDKTMTAEDIAVLDRAMDETGIVHRTEVYEGAGHGYTMRDESTYTEEASERHFATLFELLSRTLEVS